MNGSWNKLTPGSAARANASAVPPVRQPLWRKMGGVSAAPRRTSGHLRPGEPNRRRRRGLGGGDGKHPTTGRTHAMGRGVSSHSACCPPIRQAVHAIARSNTPVNAVNQCHEVAAGPQMGSNELPVSAARHTVSCAPLVMTTLISESMKSMDASTPRRLVSTCTSGAPGGS